MTTGKLQKLGEFVARSDHSVGAKAHGRRASDWQCTHPNNLDVNRVPGFGAWQLGFGSHGFSCNDRCRDLLGVRTTLTSSQQFFEAVHPDDRDRLIATIDAAARQDFSFQTEFRTAASQGARWLALTGQPVKGGPDEEARNVAGIVLDVTDLKRTQQALAETAEQYRSLISAMAEGVVLQDAAGAVYACNPSAERLLGLTADQMSGRTSTDPRWQAIHEDGSDFPGEAHPSMVTLRTGKPCSGVVMGIRKPDGEVNWISINTQPLFNVDSKEPYAVLSTFSDISAARASEQKLLKAQELFGKAFRSSPEAITITSLETGRYIEVNETFLRKMEYDRAQVIGETAVGLGIWVDPEQRLWLTTRIAKHETVRDAEVQLRTRTGKILTVQLRVEPIELQGEQCLLASLRDMTERSLLEEQLRQAQKMEAVGRLAGGVAHDFNNLLCVILGRGELLLRDLPPNHPGRKAVEQMRQAGNLAISLTRQLLAWSRGQSSQEPIVLDLNTVILNIEDILRRLIREDIEFSVELQPALGRVRANPDEIIQVIMNLVVNARDAMPGGGRLLLKTRDCPDTGSRVPPSVVLSVADTGTGMDQETQSHIFEPFFTTKQRGAGTGLGLSTVNNIVRKSGGKIIVSSRPGQGTTFDICFPVTEEETTMPVEGVAEEPVCGGDETILLVEDAVEIRELTCEFLRSFGYRVLECACPEDALRVARENPGSIHLLLSDVVMPKLSGFVLAKQLTSLHSEMKVLFISGYPDDAIVRHVAPQGRVALLPKPYTRESLARRVRQVLDQKHSA